jgi:predicted DNA-binding protein with PD1-like motif
VRSTEVSSGRRLVAVLEPGDEVLASIGALCAEHQFLAAIVSVFFGAFTRVTLIGTHEPVEDEDAPMPRSTTVEWVEGLGAATVAPDEDGGLIVHLHAAVGRKSAGALRMRVMCCPRSRTTRPSSSWRRCSGRSSSVARMRAPTG